MLTRNQQEMLHLHACLLLQYQRPKQAVTFLKALILAAPDFLAAQYTMVLACLEADEYHICIDWCTKLLDTTTTKKDALYLCLSRAYWRQGEANNAKQAYENYLRHCEKKQPNKKTIEEIPTIKN